MQTTDLIDRLAGELRPMPDHATLKRLAAGVAIAVPVALVSLWLLLGARADFSSALLTVAFWRKWLFAFAIAAAASALCVRLARPEAGPGKLPAILAIPFLAMGALALLEIQGIAASDRMEVWLGRSALRCPWIITALALPVFAGVLWAFRQFAPTRPRLAGFAAGCLAGSVAAVVYAIHCNEVAASFVATWYSAGMLLPAIAGFLLGPRILRW